jgi:eukaryotic-like serine/threonine-protein kinase
MPITRPALSKYRLIARLGRGGMADVYLVMSADRSGFNKLQVLKISRPDVVEQVPEWLEMFEAEARLGARLNHPNIVQTYGVGVEDGHHFMAMEYLDGQNLSRVQKRGRSSALGFPLEMHVFVLCQVLEALEYAHGLSDYDGTPLHIVHRDISPQNVIITYTGQTKVVDFGIAKTCDSQKTRAGVIKGKLAYISPEQVLNENVDHRADLFSVGVMLWSAIARCNMHGNASPPEIEERLVQGKLPQIRDVVPQLPESLEHIVNRALAVKPADRYPHANAFRQDLIAFLEGAGKVGAREIGERVAGLFARERLEIDSVICKVMAQAKLGEAERAVSVPVKLPESERSSLPPQPPNAARSSRLRAEPGRITRRVSYTPSSNPAPPVQVARNGSTAGARHRRWIPVALGTALVVGSLGVALQPPGDQDQAGVTDTGHAAQRVSSSVRLNIWTVPSGAELVLDGMPLGTSPYSGERPRESAEHTLVINAPGFTAQRIQTRFEEDRDIEVRLATNAEPPSAPVALKNKRPRSRQARTGEAQVEQRDVAPSPPAGETPLPPTFDFADPWAPD